MAVVGPPRMLALRSVPSLRVMPFFVSLFSLKPQAVRGAERPQVLRSQRARPHRPIVPWPRLVQIWKAGTSPGKGSSACLARGSKAVVHRFRM
ncbi:hypothetical protein Pyn_09571 [Prunus yedoensis var. nudiflora]|uniref:Uncharacterized protein n=1 Tax=Prunus yedoensis var. nudiflora TaxID=2094558 RepID=A0A314Z654_PRUYE|nr:hypothetical protein Pyn_09571 [Prunus yedoensis var. nudiflora]